MKDILRAKLRKLEVLKEEASNYEYYIGQYDLVLELLSIYDDYNIR
jgi:hypothetical protein